MGTRAGGQQFAPRETGLAPSAQSCAWPKESRLRGCSAAWAQAGALPRSGSRPPGAQALPGPEGRSPEVPSKSPPTDGPPASPASQGTLSREHPGEVRVSLVPPFCRPPLLLTPRAGLVPSGPRGPRCRKAEVERTWPFIRAGPPPPPHTGSRGTSAPITPSAHELWRQEPGGRRVTRCSRPGAWAPQPQSPRGMPGPGPRVRALVDGGRQGVLAHRLGSSGHSSLSLNPVKLRASPASPSSA